MTGVPYTQGPLICISFDAAWARIAEDGLAIMEE